MNKKTKNIIIALAVITILIIATGLTAFFLGDDKKDEPSKPVEKSYEVISELPENMKTEKIVPAEAFAGGDGTEQNPYQIADANQLSLFAKNMKDGDASLRKVNYILTNDIYLNDVSDYDNWQNQAPKYSWDSIENFEGTFNGNNHKIYGMFICDIVDGSEYHCGLFGDVDNAYIKNLSLEKGYIYMINKVGDIGGIAGVTHNSVIENCQSNVEIGDRVGTLFGIGGICGESSLSVLKNCANYGDVSTYGGCSVGGIVGRLDTYNSENCKNYANVSGIKQGYTAVGGVVGTLSDSLCRSKYSEEKPDAYGSGNYVKHENSDFKDFENYGNVTTEEGQVGGVVGIISISETTSSCTGFVNSGIVKCNTETSQKPATCGGVIGEISVTEKGVDMPADAVGNLTLSECVNKGETRSLFNSTEGISGSLGGIVSYATTSGGTSLKVLNCKNEGTFSENIMLGGIAGSVLASDFSTIELVGCVNSSSIKSNGTAAGIVGMANIQLSEKEKEIATIIIDRCKNNGNIINDGGFVAGILGDYLSINDRSNGMLAIRNCENNGKISGVHFATIGGIAGNLFVAKHSIVFENNTNNGELFIKVNEVQDRESGEMLSAVGGICGMAGKSVTFKNNINNGKVTVDGNKTGVIYKDDLALAI